MTPKRDKGQVGVTALSKLLGCSRQGIYDALKDGRIRREPNGRFDVERVKSDWAQRSRAKIDSLSARIAERDANQEHHALVFLQSIWAHSLGGMALFIRDQGKLSPEITFRLLAGAFLIQWQTISESLGVPQDEPMDFSAPMSELITASGMKRLTKWLSEQPAVNWKE